MCDKCEIVRNWWKSYLLTDGTVIFKFCPRSYVLNVIWVCLSVSLYFDDSYMARRAQLDVGLALTRLLTRNNLGGTWTCICSPDIRRVSALEGLRNCARQIDIYLLIYFVPPFPTTVIVYFGCLAGHCLCIVHPSTPIMHDAMSVYICAHNFSETWNKYSPCEWAFLKQFSRSRVQRSRSCVNAAVAEASISVVWHWGSVSTEVGDRIRVQFPVRDIYLGMWPTTQVNSAWPFLCG